jgi:hypothetical protein
LCRRQTASTRILEDVVGEGARAVEVDHRDQLAVPLLELRVTVDRDLDELEAQLVPQRAHLRARPLAEVAALSVENGYSNGLRYIRGRAHA